MDSINILFLGGAKRVSLAERFLKAGEAVGKAVSIFSYELGKNVPVSEVATIVVGKRWDDHGVIGDITHAIEKNDIHILLPFVDPATVLAAQLKEKLKKCFVPVSDEEACGVFFNKAKAQEWFLDNSFNVPVFKNVFPAIAKPVTGSASQGIEVLNSETSLKVFFETHKVENYLIQRLVRGPEYTVDCYAEQTGKILAVVPRIRLQVSGGEVIQSRTVHRPDMVEICKQIITKAGLRGPVNIQFIEDEKNGELYVMEVNPRFGGGVIASIEAGADMPGYLINEYLGRENKPLENWNENLLMMRANREFFRDNAADH